MDWLSKYRLNPDWFFPDDESETEKANREEIFKLIKNHDILIDSKVENRDVKISHLVGDDYLDPLLSLNPYLDALFGKIDFTMILPNEFIYYIEKNNHDSCPGRWQPYGGENNMVSKLISSQTIFFDTIEEMSKWIDETRIYEEFFIFQIQPSVDFSTTKFGLRFASVSKKLNILMRGSRMTKVI